MGNLKVLFWNARGINNKFEELKQYIIRNNTDIICVCETFLKGKQSVALAGYSTLTMNRSNTRLGGLLIMFKKSLIINQYAMPDLDIVEAMGICVLNSTNTLLFKLILLYLPGRIKDNQIVNHFIRDIDKLTVGDAPLLIVGDFNAKNRAWNCNSNNKAGVLLQRHVLLNNLFIHAPDEPTYVPTSSFFSPSTIDLLLSNGKISFSGLSTIKDFTSDHMPVRFTIQVDGAHNCDQSVARYGYQFANWKSFRDKLNQLTTLNLSVLNPTQIDKSIAALTKATIDARDFSIPKVKTGRDNIFIDADTRRLVCERNFYRRRYNRYHNDTDKWSYRILSKRIQKNINDLKNRFFHNQLSECKPGDRNLFKLIKQKQEKNRTPRVDDNGKVLLNDDEKVRALSKQFSKSHKNPLEKSHYFFTKAVDDTVNQFTNRPSRISPPVISFSEIQQEITTLERNKSPGPDQISNRLIKNFPAGSINLLRKIFNACLSLGYFPDAWKLANVIAIPKPGKNDELTSSYRPISLLCGFGKIFEKIIKNKLINTKHYTDALPNVQFGFRDGHSTSHQLLRIGSTAVLALNEIKPKSMGIISLDIEKAFDAVWHNGLIYKMIKAKFPDYLIKICASYLKDRKFRVVLNNKFSDLEGIPFGVPQGGVLSPVLYNFYTADLPMSRDCLYGIFADDTAVAATSRFYKQIETKLQNAFLLMNSYFHKWKIKVNTAKTQAIFITRRRTKQLPTGPISVGGSEVAWQGSLKYLGFTINTSLTINTHINEVLCKSNRALGLLYTFLYYKSTLSVQIKIHIYLLYLRPLFTYAPVMLLKGSYSSRIPLQRFQNKVLRIILNKRISTPIRILHQISNVPTIEDFLKGTVDRFYVKNTVSLNPLIRDLTN